MMAAATVNPQSFGVNWLLRSQLGELGDVITFYSYKGGTGRSMALVNCAGLIAEHLPSDAKPILLMDFDIEAPGLHRYLLPFIPLLDQQPRAGTLELFGALAVQVDERIEALRQRDPTALPQIDDEATFELVAKFDLAPFIVPTTFRGLQLIVAGSFDETYDRRLAGFDWQGLFSKAPALFRCLSDRFANAYSHTFIDSRTGLNDTSGICTMLLPNVLVVVFTPNSQSLTGIEHLVRRALEYRAGAVDGRELRIYPLPSRVDNQVEHFRQTWRKGDPAHALFGAVTGYQPLFETLFADSLRGSSAQLNEYFDVVQVPHTADYAYGERLCFGSPTPSDSLSVRNAYEQFLPWIVTGAQPWERPADIALNQQGLLWLRETGADAGPDDASGWHPWFHRLTRVLDDSGSPVVSQHAALHVDLQFDIGIVLSVAHAYSEGFDVALMWLKRASDAYSDDLAPSVCAELPTQLLELWSGQQKINNVTPALSEWLDLLDRLMAQWQPLQRARRAWLTALARVATEWRLHELSWRALVELEGEVSVDALHSMLSWIRELEKLGDLDTAISVQEKRTSILRTAYGDADQSVQDSDRELAQLRSKREQSNGALLPPIERCRYSAYASYSYADDACWNSWVSCFVDELNRALPSRLRGIRVPGVFLSGGIGTHSGSRLKHHIEEAFSLIIFVHENYVDSEWTAELEYFYALYKEKSLDRLYIVAMSESAMARLCESPRWRKLFGANSPMWLTFFSESNTDRPIEIYTSNSRTIIVQNAFWERFVHLRESLASQIRDSAAVNKRSELDLSTEPIE